MTEQEYCKHRYIRIRFDKKLASLFCNDCGVRVTKWVEVKNNKVVFTGSYYKKYLNLEGK